MLFVPSQMSHTEKFHEDEKSLLGILSWQIVKKRHQILQNMCLLPKEVSVKENQDGIYMLFLYKAKRDKNELLN